MNDAKYIGMDVHQATISVADYYSARFWGFKSYTQSGEII